MAEGVVFGNGFWLWYSVLFGAGGSWSGEWSRGGGGLMNFNQKWKIIDLSQEIYEGMPVFGMHQKTFFIDRKSTRLNSSHGS